MSYTSKTPHNLILQPQLLIICCFTRLCSVSATLSTTNSGFLSTLFDVGGIFGGIVAGFASDKLNARASTCGVMLVIGAAMVSDDGLKAFTGDHVVFSILAISGVLRLLANTCFYFEYKLLCFSLLIEIVAEFRKNHQLFNFFCNRTFVKIESIEQEESFLNILLKLRI